MNRQNFIWTFVGLIVGIPMFVFAGVKWYESRFQRLPVFGGPEHHIDTFQLVNAVNKPVSINDLENKIVVADFFFTHCGTVCPKMTSSMKKVQEVLSSNNNLLLVSFSIDPRRDSSQRLAWFASKHDIDQHNWQFLTGDKKQIYRLARKSFLVTATDGDGGPDDFIHSDQLVLVDQQKKIRGFYSGTNDKAVQRLITDIQKLINE